MSFTHCDGPLAVLVGDAEVERLFGFPAELAAMLRFEAALARAEAACGVIPAEAAERIAAATATFEADRPALDHAMARDGVVVPDLVRQLRAHIGEPHSRHLHHGTTSQDVTDTALVLRLADLLPMLDQRLDRVVQRLDGLQAKSGAKPLMGRTRMQQAVPITVGERLASWAGPVRRARERMRELAPRLLVLQFGGAVGNLYVLKDKGRDVGAALARDLGLGWPEHNWQAERDRIAEFANWLTLVTGALGKIGQDVALMAQNEFGEIGLSGGGGSSAMAHKQNPVKAEVLVALARHNATLLSGMQHAVVHEQERSGSAWTLEWMLLPSMAVAAGGATRTAVALLESVEFDRRSGRILPMMPTGSLGGDGVRPGRACAGRQRPFTRTRG